MWKIKSEEVHGHHDGWISHQHSRAPWYAYISFVCFLFLFLYFFLWSLDETFFSSINSEEFSKIRKCFRETTFFKDLRNALLLAFFFHTLAWAAPVLPSHRLQPCSIATTERATVPSWSGRSASNDVRQFPANIEVDVIDRPARSFDFSRIKDIWVTLTVMNIGMGLRWTLNWPPESLSKPSPQLLQEAVSIS